MGRGDEHPSLRPPLHGTDDAEVPGTCTWALLDIYAYVADRANATSASAALSDGTPVRLTFCAAPPPLVSYLCVWCPGLPPAEVDVRNTVLAAESDLLLLCVALRCWDRDRADYFVYKAGGRPALTLLPDPTEFLTRSHNITLLAHHDDGDADRHFRMAILKPNTRAANDYELCVFGSKDQRWTTRGVSVDCAHYINTSKVVALGDGDGGSRLAFVDLWRGIIVCDVRGRAPPRYVPLPAPLVSPDICLEDPLCSRDIVYVGGRLTVVELRHVNDPSDSRAWSWEVSTWSRTVAHHFSEEEEWHHQHTVRSTTIAVDHNTDNVHLLPKLKGSDGTLRRPELGSLYVDLPMLSLTDANVVYIMAKVSPRDKKALVLCIDTTTPRVQGLAVFDAQRMVGYTYVVQCRIPEYFHMAKLESATA